jgi:hypothetical protein
MFLAYSRPTSGVELGGVSRLREAEAGSGAEGGGGGRGWRDFEQRSWWHEQAEGGGGAGGELRARWREQDEGGVGHRGLGSAV